MSVYIMYSNILHIVLYICMCVDPHFIFQRSFRWMRKLKKRYRKFPYIPWPQIHTASPPLTPLSRVAPSLTHRYHQKSRAHIKVHSLCRPFWWIWQMCNIPAITVSYRTLTAPSPLCSAQARVPLQTLATNDLFPFTGSFHSGFFHLATCI
jgi:hypothetical protein